MGSLAIQPNSRRAYALAFALLAAALLAQWGLRPLLGNTVPFLFLFPAVGIAAMYGGWKPAAAVLAAGIVNALLWIHPPGPLKSVDPRALAAVGGFLLGGGLLVAIGGRVSQLRARAVDAEERLRAQVQDLHALHELNAAIALLPSLDRQLESVLRTLCELYGARQGAVSLCEPGDRVLRLAASIGLSAQGLAQLAAPRPGDGPGGLAVAEGRAVIVCDTEQDAHFAPWRPLARQEGFRAVHSRPLRRRDGQVFGAISVYLDEARGPSPREDRLGDLCASTAAVLAERDAAVRRASALSRQLEVALDTSAVPFCLLSPLRGDDGQIAGFRWDYLNTAAARLLGAPSGQSLVGQPVRASIGAARLEPGLLGRVLAALHDRSTVQFETWSERLDDGRRRWFHVIASPHEEGLAVWFADVTQRKGHEEELRAADRRKDEFLATLAHELRNPLAPIRQAALIAKSPSSTDAQKRWSCDVIERQVGHMARLLDDLLDVSRITRGKLELRRERVPLSQVVDVALETVRPLLEARRQHLAVELPAQAAWLEADPVRLAQVLSNLLGNAVRYTPEGGHIALAGAIDGATLRLDVRDDGIGIAPQSLEKVFEMFTQVRGREGTAGGAGLGIGLALSRGLVELHGGRLQARSEGLGRGSTFTVELPLAPPPAPPPAPEAAPAGTAARRPRRVLVADDNRDAAQSLADLLSIEGHEVAVAFDGEQALAEFQRFAPDVALLDIGMPGLTGNQVASAIRARPEGGATLLVAITGWGQERDREAARAAGFDAHFTKPVDPMQVLQLLSG